MTPLSPDLPKKVRHTLYDVFGYPEVTHYVQLATQSLEGPSLRTLKLSAINERGDLLLMSNTHTKKWEDLTQNNRVEILLYHPTLNIQIKASGMATLLDASEELVASMWKKVRSDVKSAMAPNPERQSNTVPDNVGVICVTPHYWEVMELDVQHYPTSFRCAYEKSSIHWKERHLPVIS